MKQAIVCVVYRVSVGMFAVEVNGVQLHRRYTNRIDAEISALDVALALTVAGVEVDCRETNAR